MTTTELWTFSDQAVARVDLTGFELEARDGLLGTVAQSIEGSGGGYLIVDPGVAMPLGRQVLMPVGLIKKVDVENKRVSVDLDREQVRNAPAYEATQPRDEHWRRGVSDYYSPLFGRRTRRASGSKASRASASQRSRARQAGASRRTRTSTGGRSRRPSEGQTKAELYSEARRLGIEGRSKMSKAELARSVGRRRGSSGAQRSRAKANPVEVQAFLEGVGYPTRKRELLREAENQGARSEVRATLRRLPDKQFESPTDVSEAIGALG